MGFHPFLMNFLVLFLSNNYQNIISKSILVYKKISELSQIFVMHVCFKKYKEPTVYRRYRMALYFTRKILMVIFWHCLPPGEHCYRYNEKSSKAHARYSNPRSLAAETDADRRTSPWSHGGDKYNV